MPFERKRVIRILAAAGIAVSLLLSACGSDAGGEASADDHEAEDAEHEEPVDLEPEAAVGDVLADVPMTLLDGSTVQIGDYQGSVLLLFFWSTDWGAAAGLEQVASYSKFLADDGLVAYGVNSARESMGSIENYLDNFRTPLPVVLDEDQTLLRLFGARDGTMVWIGPDSDLKSIVEEFKFTEMREENVLYRIGIYLGDS